MPPPKPKTPEELAREVQGDFLACFNTSHGENVLKYLCSAFYVTSPAFRPGMDAVALAFNEGSRYAVLRILALAGRVNLEDLEEIWRKAK